MNTNLASQHNNRISPSLVSPRRLETLKLASTSVLLCALVFAWTACIFAFDSEEAFGIPARFVAAGLGLAIWIESRAGIRNLVRTDLFMVSVLFLLTFFEHLFPQDKATSPVSLSAAQTAVEATLLAFAAILIGRHAFPARRPLPKLFDLTVSPQTTMTLLLASALLGYLYMLIPVRFDIFEMFRQLSQPRFTQAWTRGRYGSLSTLLNEFALLKYLIPPLTASIIAQARRYRGWQKLLSVALLALVFFESFAVGTRNVFLVHLITFGATLLLLVPRLTLTRLTLILGATLAVSFFAIYYLPEIRTVGLQNFNIEESSTNTLFVDMNLNNITRLAEVFPESVSYLGFEVPYIAAIRPIPRVLWPGKPEGLSLGIEEALGVTGMTLSATFVGELWMAGGYFAVLTAGLIFGALAALWNRRVARARSNFDMIFFAVGLFPAGIVMRSFMSVGPALLPLLALAIYLKLRKRRHD